MRSLLLLAVLLCACGPALPSDPQVLAGMAEGAARSTQIAAAEQAIAATRAEQYTQSAAEYEATQYAIDSAYLSTLTAATQAAQHGRATDAAQMVQDAAAAGTATAISGAAQATATARTIQATRQAAEYDRQVRTADQIKETFILFLKALLVIVVLAVTFVAYVISRSQRMKIMSAAWRTMVYAAPDGSYGYMLPSGEYKKLGTANPEAQSQLAPPKPLVHEAQYTEAQAFIMRAAQHAPDGWRSRTIPRWSEMQIGAAQWHRLMGEIRKLDLAQSLPSGTYVRDGKDLAWVFQHLPSPTPLSGVVIEG